jgi:isocitrate dehydrogenase (NAD+)
LAQAASAAPLRAALIEGDGIGPEITEATVRTLEAVGAHFEWERALAGERALRELGDPLPQASLDILSEHRLALKAPLATPSGGGFRSVNVALRQHFDLYANLRPVRTLPGVPSRYQNVDIVLVRENTEDLYAGVEHYIDARRSAAESIAIITRHGSERVIRWSFEYARKHGRRKVTLVHKANILKLSNGLFLDCGRALAAQYPDIEFEDMIVDATAMKLVTAPERFDVIVTMNLFGDILSDLMAGLVGGLGVAPSANIGEGGCAIFEAVHGTAPDIAGKGLANPTALMLSAALLLDHVGQLDAAARLRRGIAAALQRSDSRTRDLGGEADTERFTRAVIAAATA